MSLFVFQPMGDNIWLYLFIIAVLEALVLYFWRFRKLPGAMPQVYAQACKSVWILCLIMASMSSELQDKVLWISLQHMSIILLAYVWFMFIVQISGQEKMIPRVVKYALRGMLACLCLVILSNNWHGWYWRDVWLRGGTLIAVRGPAVGLLKGFGYLLCLISLAFSVRWLLATAGWRRRQALVIIVAPFFSFAGNLAGFVPGGAALLSRELGFLLSGLYIAWAYRRWFIFRILPQAQDAVVRNMIDGLLIIDDEDYIVDMNPTAKIIFAGLPATVGGKFQEVVAAWPALAEFGDTGVKTMEAAREYPEGRRYYQLNIISLASQGSLLGKVIVLKDITEQKHIQAQLFEQKQALSILTERNRLGRELHDGQGQIWSYLQLELQTIRSLLNTAQLEEAIKQVERLAGVARDLNADVRESIVGLKQTAADSRDFVATLRKYLAWYEKNHGIATQLILPTEPVADLFNHTSEVQLLRIIQEALTNIRKHAKARQAEVMIRMMDNQVTVFIVDDGCGFDMEASPTGKKSYGLQIMAERAKEAGGRLHIESKPGAGTKVIVQFCSGKVEGDENTVG